MISSDAMATRRPRVLRGAEEGEGGVSAWLPAAPVLSIEERIAAAAKEAWDAGYRSGRAEGEGTAQEAEAVERRKVRDAVAVAAGAVAGIRATAVTTFASEAVELGIEIARLLLDRELHAGASLDTEALTRALALVPSGEDLLVRVNPHHALKAEDVEALAPGTAVRLVEDASVEVGGCVVEAGACRIDAQIGSALERARAVLLGAEPDEAAAA